MSPALTLVVLVLAVVCFLLAAAGVTTLRRPVAFGWLGLALLVLIPLVSTWQAL